MAVIYSRSREKFLLPILFTRKRIVWAYPERETVYKIYEMQYIDLKRAEVKFPSSAMLGVLTLTTVHDNKQIIFKYIKNGKKEREDMRAALFELRTQMIEKVGGRWELKDKKNLISESYILEESDDVLSDIPLDDVFEDAPIPGQGCLESTDKLFSHFPDDEKGSDEDSDNSADVFELESEDESVKSEAENDAAIKERVERMIESAKTEEEMAEETDDAEDESEITVPLNDASILPKSSGNTDPQWTENEGGDAVILPGGRSVIGGARYKNLERNAIAQEDVDDSEVYISDDYEMRKRCPEEMPCVLEPIDGFDEEKIDKTLDELRDLRNNGIITQDEYLEKCRVLFKKNNI